MITPKNYTEMAIAFAVGTARPDSDAIGFVVKGADPEWDHWQAYFLAKGMKARAGTMSLCRGGFTVPCRLPRDFDPDCRYTLPKKSRLASEMPLAEREALVAQFQRSIAKIATKSRPQRSPTSSQAEPKPDPLGRRELSDAEKTSAARLAASSIQHRDAAE